MRLQRAIIHNFRAIEHLSIDLEGYSLLVGANNAGKSSVVDALRACYEKDGYRFDRERDFPKNGAADAESWIELWFKLTTQENDSIPSEMRWGDKTLRVRKWFVLDEAVGPRGRKVGLLYLLNPDLEGSSKPLSKILKKSDSLIGSMIYVPALGRIDDHVKLGGPSPMRDLFRFVIDRETGNRGSRGQVDAAIENLRRALVGGSRNRAGLFSSIEKDLDGLLKPWNASFRVNAGQTDEEAIVKALIDWQIVDNSTGIGMGINEFGSGFQRHFGASLIQLAAKVNSCHANSRESEAWVADSFTLLLFEEPEAFLHPTQQSALAVALQRIAKGDGMQVLCTTHSPHFLSPNAENLNSLVRLSKNEGKTQAFQISKPVWKKIVDSQNVMREVFGANSIQDLGRSDEALVAELEAMRYSSWLNGGRAAVMFSEMVLLVEGETERALITKLIDEGKIRTGSRGNVYVLDCLGKYNMHRFIKLLSAFGIRHSVLHDLDENKGRHRKINDFIKSQADKDWTIAVGTFRKDLETYLGLPRTKRSGDKPLVVLYAHYKKVIPKKKLKHFCRTVEELLR